MSQDDEFFLEIQEGFLQEAADLLGRVEALSLELEKNPESSDTFSELARLAHNFKGSGKAVGFDHISKLAHRIEDYILAIRNKVVSSSPESIDFLFKCLDRLKVDIEQLTVDKKVVLNHDEILAEIQTRLSEGSPQETPATEDTVENKDEPKNTQHDQKALISTADEKQKVSVQEVLRIQKQKIDYLLEAFGEQVILQSTLEQYKFDLDKNRDLIQKTISQLTKLTFELQNHTLSLTMVPIAPTFVKLERAARDAARLCEKKIQVFCEGGETEVDKTLIDSLSDSLTHMVRNAVDHAIEDSKERLEKNKPETGEVSISAQRAGGQLWIEVRDDGRGLDPERLKKKALLNGLIKEDDLEKLTPEQSYQLIFENGFSTKESVSEVSGRGVGMNVVKEAVSALKGVIEITSEIGRGTTFRMKLPLSLAIFNGAIVKINQHKFVVPNSEISEIARVSYDHLTVLGDQEAAIKIRNEVFQLIDLREKLSANKKVAVSKEGKLPVLISRKMGNKAFLIDEVLGMQKVVQKSLGEEVKTHKEYAAGTILSDGSPGVILNLSSFIKAS